MVVNWDRLVNVCYLGGYAGDFFSNLLYQNFNPLHDFVGSADTNRYNFNNLNFKKYSFALKSLNDLLLIHSDLEEYEKLMLTLKDVDLSKIIELDDDTDLKGEAACSGGSCEIK
jgi:hypothetical protein